MKINQINITYIDYYLSFSPYTESQNFKFYKSKNHNFTNLRSEINFKKQYYFALVFV